MSKRKLTYEDFKKYFSNNQPNKEKHAFEKEMMRDAFEEEAFDGLSGLSHEEFENDINELKTGIQNRSRNKRRIIPVWFRYAASILILIGVGVSVFVIWNNRVLHDSIIKEQFTQEMELPDSDLLDVEYESVKSDSTTQTIVVESQQKPLIAENREFKKEKKQTGKPDAVQGDVEITNLMVLDEAVSEENDNEVIEIPQFEKEEEIVNDEIPEYKESIQNVLQSKTAGEKIRDKAVPSKSAQRSEKSLESGKNVKIKGKVLGAEDDLSIPGVSITIKGDPKTGTTTDIDGNFALTLPQNDEELKTLIASFVGMKTQEIKLDQDSNLLVYMEPEVLEMDEVVVNAVGIKRSKKELGYQEQEENPNNIEASPPNQISMREYKKQILQELNYDKLKAFPGKYKIQVELSLFNDGTISKMNFTDTPDPVFDSELEHVIRNLGKWNPETKENIPVSCKVNFTLKIEVQ